MPKRMGGSQDRKLTAKERRERAIADQNAKDLGAQWGWVLPIVGGAIVLLIAYKALIA
jgi:hypothetical protein